MRLRACLHAGTQTRLFSYTLSFSCFTDTQKPLSIKNATLSLPKTKSDNEEIFSAFFSLVDVKRQIPVKCSGAASDAVLPLNAKRLDMD